MFARISKGLLKIHYRVAYFDERYKRGFKKRFLFELYETSKQIENP